jgi:hypothetical protein
MHHSDLVLPQRIKLLVFGYHRSGAGHASYQMQAESMTQTCAALCDRYSLPPADPFWQSCHTWR